MDASSQKLYFTDVGNHRLRAIEFDTGIITTVAGGGSTDIGDGGLATEAMFSTHPMRVALGDADNLFVTDAHQDRIRRIDGITGIITTIAGNGDEAFSGDGGIATKAGLCVPHGCRFDTAGNLFIADTHSQRIRRVDAATGIISTYAGTGEEGYTEDGTVAVHCKLNTPLAVDVAVNGDVYFVDTDNLRYRRIDAVSGTVHTVAGCGKMGVTEDRIPALEAKFGRPRDILLRGQYVYLVDGDNACIFAVDQQTGLIQRIAGCGTNGFSGDGGPATTAELGHCYSMAMDPKGNIYIKDCTNNRIRKVDVDTGIISTIAGTGSRGFEGDGGPALEATLAIG